MSTVHISVLYLERDLFLNASVKKKHLAKTILKTKITSFFTEFIKSLIV